MKRTDTVFAAATCGSGALAPQFLLFFLRLVLTPGSRDVLYVLFHQVLEDRAIE